MVISNATIHEKVAAGELDFTVHAVFEAAEDYIFVSEVEQALLSGEIIEDDPPRSRCIVCGRISPSGLVHVVVEYADWLVDNQSNLVVVTVYRPDPERWIDGRVRKT